MRKLRYYKSHMHLYNSIKKVAKDQMGINLSRNDLCLNEVCKMCIEYDEKSGKRHSLATEFYHYCLKMGFEGMEGNWDIYLEGPVMKSLEEKEKNYIDKTPPKWHMQRISNFVETYIKINGEGISELLNIKDVHGVYKLYDFHNNLIYVGRSKDLGSRIMGSIYERKADSFSYIPTETLDDTWLIESYLISKHKPKENSKGNTHSNISQNISNFMEWYIENNLNESKKFTKRDVWSEYKNLCQASNIYYDLAKEMIYERLGVGRD